MAAFGQWQPIETAPKDGTPVLVYWPCIEIDEDGDVTGKVLADPGLVGVSQNAHGGWEDPECLNAVGYHFDDLWEYGAPTHWMPLPTAPDAQS
jgi:hypothetical protein